MLNWIDLVLDTNHLWNGTETLFTILLPFNVSSSDKHFLQNFYFTIYFSTYMLLIYFFTEQVVLAVETYWSITSWPVAIKVDKILKSPNGTNLFTGMDNWFEVTIQTLKNYASVVGWLVGFPACQPLLGYLMPKSVFLLFFFFVFKCLIRVNNYIFNCSEYW